MTIKFYDTTDPDEIFLINLTEGVYVLAEEFKKSSNIATTAQNVGIHTNIARTYLRKAGLIPQR